MPVVHTRRFLLALGACTATALGAAALPTVSPVAATTVVVPPACVLPTTPASEPAPREYSRSVTATGTLVITGRPKGGTYASRGCRNDSAEVASVSYVLFKAPRSTRWLAYIDSVSFGGRAAIVDLAVPATERQFERARKRTHARVEVRLPKVKGVVYLTRDQAPAFTTFAKQVDGLKPTVAERTAAADAVLSAGDPFEDGTPVN